MPSSNQVKINSTSISLVVDASTSPVQVGIPNSQGWESIAQTEQNALEGLFSITEKVLKETQNSIANINRIFFCEGPGSTLGLRIASAFVKTIKWRKKGSDFCVFSYNALDLAALLAPNPESIIQAPFRVGFRFVRIPHTDPLKSEKKIFTEEEAMEKFAKSFHLPDLRKRSKINFQKTLAYDLSKIRGLSDLKVMSKPCAHIKPYNPKAPEFKKWSPNFLKK